MIFHFAVGTKPYKLHAMAEHSLGIYVDFYRTLQNCPCLRKKKKKKEKKKKGKGEKKMVQLETGIQVSFCTSDTYRKRNATLAFARS